MFVINATDYAPVTPVTPPCDIIPIFIGYKGENHARCLIFDLTDCIEEFGDGGFAISFMRHGDAQPYIVTDTDQLDYTAIWEINATDTAVEGYGMVQLQYIVGETVCKTAMYRTVTFDSNESAGDVPDPYENLLDQIAAYAALAQGSAAAAERAEVNATAQADRIISTTADAVGDWLEDNIGEISGYVIDKSLTVSDAAADAKVAGDWIRASFFTDEASGSVASFPDGADGVPVKDLTVSVQAVQSGTGDPSPNNIRAITGWSEVTVTRCGKNMFSTSTATLMDNVMLNRDTGLVASDSAMASLYIKCEPNTKYTISRTQHATAWRFNAGYTKELPAVGVTVYGFPNILYPSVDADGRGSVTITTGADAKYLFVYLCWKTMETIANAESDLQIEISPSVTPYEPYNGTTYTITFPDAAGTVYGGTLDVTTGVLTVNTVGVVFDGTEEWGTNGSGTSKFFRYIYSGVAASDGSGAATPRACSHYPNASITSSTTSQGFMAYTSTSYPNDMWMQFRPDLNAIADATAWKSFLATQNANGTPVTAIAEIASPQTFALTPTQVTSLLGNNNIFADCGGSDVTYRADPSLYLAKLTNPDNDMIADANIVSGQYFTVGNQLYLATANIANGGAIIVGTNCTLTNLAAALNAINS